MLVSVIMPTYNDSKTTLDSVAKLDRFMRSLEFPYEIIVVDDGSQEEQRVEQSALPSGTKLVQLDTNQGKGYAVRQGMLEAKGTTRMFIDNDLAYDLRCIPAAIDAIESKYFHFVAGDRTHPKSELEARGASRAISSVIFRRVLNTLIIGSVFDSQCGFKAFSGPLAEKLFSVATINRFAFDVELIYLVLKFKVPFKFIPVILSKTRVSSVSLAKDGWRAAFDSIRVPVQWYMGMYPKDCLLDLVESPFSQTVRRTG